MDVLQAVKVEVAKKLELNEPCRRAAKLNELWRAMRVAEENGVHVVVDARRGSRHWRIFLVDTKLVAQECVSQQEQYILGNTDGADCSAYDVAFSSFVKDLFDESTLIDVEVETRTERLERERLTY